MRVIVLGGGLLGVASAYYLQQLGHEVTVVDRHATPAAKARGLVELAPTGQAPPEPPTSPWRAAAERVRRRVQAWTSHLSGATHRPTARLEHLARLSAYSRESVRALRREAGVSMSSQSTPWMRIYTDASAFEQFARRVPQLQALGCSMQLLPADQAFGLEPALEPLRGKLAGAAFLRDDTSADPAGFAGSTLFMCRAAGVRFLTGHTVTRLHARNGRVDQVELLKPDGELCSLRADAYVMALGHGSAPFAQALGIPLRLRQVQEYSVLLPLKDKGRAPQLMLHDRMNRLRMRRVGTPEGERLRVWSTVRVDAAAPALSDAQRLAAMLSRVEELLPGLTDGRGAVLTVRPQVRSASGLPVIGRTRLRNLFLNLAPGAPGWTHVCGAGKSIARIVSGLPPEVEFAFAKG